MKDGQLESKVQGTYSVTQADLYHAQVQHTGWMFWVSQVMGVFLICAGLLALAITQNVQGMFPIVFGLFFLLRLRLAVRGSYRRDFVPGVETTITVSESGVEHQNAKGHSDFAWSAFVRYGETKALFLLYLQSQIFQVVPKRAFSAEQVDLLRDMLRRKIGRTKPTNRDWRLALFTVVVITVFVLLGFIVYRTRAMK